MKPTHRKSWAGNLSMWSDLTLDPSFKVKRGHPNLKVLIMSTPLGGGYIIFAFFAVRCPASDVRRPMSGVTHGFRSFKGKVLELLSPNLVCRLIGSVACLGLLLAVVPLLLTE